MNIYKYCKKDIYRAMFKKKEFFSLKFSKLKDFNDPYEFFLTIDYNIPSNQLATYNEMLSMQLTYLATCFSKTPINTPMWAHYADDFQGYSLEINEKRLTDHLNNLNKTPIFDDITYRNKASEYLNKRLQYASIRCKYRDIYLFERAVIHEAYFVKQKCWKYEQERRLILPENNFNINSPNIFWCPINIINSVIVGYRASEELKKYLKTLAKKFNINYYEIYPSKINLQPFMIDEKGETHKFSSKKGIQKVKYFCPNCNEPIKRFQTLCPWCSITESDKHEAKIKNGFIALHSAGLLDGYIKQMDEITKFLYKN